MALQKAGFEDQLTDPVLTILSGDFAIPENSPTLVLEPDPIRAKALRDAHRDHSQLTVLTGALVDQARSDVLLTSYSMPGLRSLTGPTPHLLRLFPGLRVTSALKVTPLAPEVLLTHLPKGAGGVHVMLDLGGGEIPVLRALQKTPLWERLTRITLRTGGVPLFEGQTPAKALADKLRRLGLVVEITGDDPDLPMVQAHPDPVLRALQGEIRTHQESLSDAQQQIAGLNARQAMLETKLAEQEQALTRAKARQDLALIHHEQAQKTHAAQVLTLPKATKPPAPQPAMSPEIQLNPRFHAQAHAHYTSQSQALYLETKSMPRAGMHYFRNAFADILGRDFSFCEWYGEPGCCGRMPCAVTGFVQDAPSGLRLRMVKSHDFVLQDPAFPVQGGLRRYVLIRDPLEVLTSWWALQVLQINADLLRANGLRMDKINYLHEAPLVAQAHALLQEKQALPGLGALRDFLDKQVTYLGGFVAKWGRILSEHPKGMGQVLPYHRIGDEVVTLLQARRAHLSDEVQTRLERFARDKADFHPRRDPFSAPSEMLQTQITQQAALFQEAAAGVLDQDTYGLLSAALPFGASQNTIVKSEDKNGTDQFGQCG